MYIHDSTNEPQGFNLVRDFGLSKKHAELLGSRLNEKHMLKPGTTFSWFRNWESDFKKYFVKEGALVYCSDIPNLIKKMGVEYKSSDWRLFTDASKRSLKGVLLHNGNLYSSVPVAHSIEMKETYNNLRHFWNSINYSHHKWPKLQES